MYEGTTLSRLQPLNRLFSYRWIVLNSPATVHTDNTRVRCGHCRPRDIATIIHLCVFFQLRATSTDVYDRVDNNCSSTVRLGHSFARAKLMAEFRFACIRRFAKSSCISRPAISARVLRTEQASYKFSFRFEIQG